MGNDLTNKWTQQDGYMQLEIKTRYDERATVLIDNESLPLVSRFKWTIATQRGDIVTRDWGKTKLMHRLIIGEEDSKRHVIHANGNKADNRMVNIKHKW